MDDYMVENLLFVAIIAVFILSVVAQSALNSKFNKYGKTQASARIPAFMAAQSMLTQNNSAATIAPVQGSLTDHYNPKTNVVGLSQTVYSDQSISALAVAAHEIGHVIQYQEGYTPIRIRNAILPVARLASNIAPWIVIAGLLLGMFNLAFIGAALFCAVLLFQLVTLPVEFNASSRALAMLRDGGFLTLEEMPKAKKVLRAAAFTYVVAAISSLVTLLRLIVLSRRTRRN